MKAIRRATTALSEECFSFILRVPGSTILVMSHGFCPSAACQGDVQPLAIIGALDKKKALLWLSL